MFLDGSGCLDQQSNCVMGRLRWGRSSSRGRSVHRGSYDRRVRVAQENPEKSLSICCARGEPSNFLWWMATASEGAHGASEEHLRLFLALSADSRSA